MPSPQETTPKQLALTMWVIWLAISSGMFIMQRVLPAGEAPASDEPTSTGISIFLLIGLALATASMVIRWLVIPRVVVVQGQLTAMIIGLALAEAVGMLALLVVPATDSTTRAVMFTLAATCLILSAPVYTLKALRS